MNDRVFLDTNVLVYAFDGSEPIKQRRAQQIIESEYPDPSPFISTQVLQEFHVAVVRKLKEPLGEEEAEQACVQLSRFPTVLIESQTVLDAIALSRRHTLSLWDSLIIRSALKARCVKLLTEDLHDGLEIEGLQITNPFQG
jgi:predicted nucleic acid-binding protein